jgi:hypothetical protein
MNTSITKPIRDCKRSEQHAIFKELKRLPGCVRRVNLLQNILKPVTYFLFIFFVGFPLLDSQIGAIGFTVVFVAFSMLFDELVWRFIVIRAVDKELCRQAEQDAGGNRR